MTCPACHAPLADNAAFCSSCGAAVPRLHPTFAQAQRDYAGLRARYDAGDLPADEFKAAVEAGAIDHAEEYWMLGVDSGKWYVHRDGAWLQAEAPRVAASGPGASTAPATPKPEPARPAAARPDSAHPAASLVPGPVTTPPLAEPPLVRLGIALAGIGVLLVVVSLWLVWTTTTLSSGSITYVGWDKEDLPRATLIVALAAFAAHIVAASIPKRGPRLAASFTALACALVLALVAAGAWFETEPYDLTDDTGLFIKARGFGPYVLVTGALMAAAGSVIAVIARWKRRRDG